MFSMILVFSTPLALSSASPLPYRPCFAALFTVPLAALRDVVAKQCVEMKHSVERKNPAVKPGKKLYTLKSASLAMHSLLATTGAELLQLKTIRGVTTILGRDVVTFFALSACQRDARTDVGALACHCHSPLRCRSGPTSVGLCSEEETRTLDLTIMSRTL